MHIVITEIWDSRADRSLYVSHRGPFLCFLRYRFESGWAVMTLIRAGSVVEQIELDGDRLHYKCLCFLDGPYLG